MPGSYMTGGRYAVATGDPFFGALLGGALRVGGALLGLGGRKAAAAAVPIAAGAATRTILTAPVATGIAARMGGVAATVSRVAAGAGKLVLGGGALAAGGQVGQAIAERALRGGQPFFQGRRRIRRMNACNPKALKRATRRLAAFHQFATSTESELRKLAPRPRRSVGGKKCR